MSVPFHSSRESLKARVWGLRAWVVPRIESTLSFQREHHHLPRNPGFCISMNVSGEQATEPQVTSGGRLTSLRIPCGLGEACSRPVQGASQGTPRGLPCHSPSCLCSVWNFESWTTDVWCSGHEFTGWRPQVLACPPGPAITWPPPIALASWPDVAPLRRDTLVATSQTRGSAV